MKKHIIQPQQQIKQSQQPIGPRQPKGHQQGGEDGEEGDGRNPNPI